MKHKKYIVSSFILVVLLVLCYSFYDQEEITVKKEKEKEDIVYVERVDSIGLVILYPQFSTIDLVCDTMPSKDDASVILVAEAAYTGECLKQFKHSNVSGDHVSRGVLYRGYKSRRNTGAFVYYNDAWKFCEHPYRNELDSAAHYGGAGFAQELIVKNSKLMDTPRKDGSKNCFRALCEHSSRLCIIESDSIITFGEFKNRLMNYGVANAIYLDMGAGWSYAWYRTPSSIIEMKPHRHDYCTNWVTFYK